ncbi:MAG: aminopeptidase P family protein [Eubacteriales bacterium]
MNFSRVNKLITQANINNCSGFMLKDSNNIKYFSGYTGEGIAIISENGCTIVTDGRYTEQAQKQADGFDVVEYKSGEYLETLYNTCDKMNLDAVCYEADVLSCDEFNTIKAAFGSINLVPTKAVGMTIRKIKDEAELEIMKKAAAVTDELLEMAFLLSKPGVSELDLDAELAYLLRKKFKAESAFDTIVASGENGSMPHAFPTGRSFKKGDMVTLDFGAALEGYKSDMTRTFSIGEPSPKMAEIYEIVREAQQMAQDALKPGIACKDVDAIARNFIAEKGYGEYFAHGLGHGVGLNIHEFPRLAPTSNDILQENMVVTVEPGIYLPGIGGVRIENTCIITKDGSKSVFSASTDMVKL